MSLLNQFNLRSGMNVRINRYWNYCIYRYRLLDDIILVRTCRAMDFSISCGVKVGIGTLVGMRLRRVSPRRVIDPLIKAHKAGLSLTTNQLESHYLARVTLTALLMRL